MGKPKPEDGNIRIIDCLKEHDKELTPEDANFIRGHEKFILEMIVKMDIRKVGTFCVRDRLPYKNIEPVEYEDAGKSTALGRFGDMRSADYMDFYFYDGPKVQRIRFFVEKERCLRVMKHVNKYCEDWQKSAA